MSSTPQSGAPLPYFKLSGGGNDFVALVEPDREPGAESIRAWCRRGLSVGADGLFVLRRTPTGARMDYFNADGRPAELCLNGTRCAVRLAAHLGWTDDEIVLETGAGAMRGRTMSTTRAGVEVSAPEAPSAIEIEHDGTSYRGWTLRVGVPHLVLVWPESLTAAPVDGLGAIFRSHPSFGEAGTNVNFVRYTSARTCEIRSYERGVEAETLACGTGVIAAAAVGLHRGWLELPARALTLGGFVLEIEPGALPSTWALSGDARILAHGTLQPAAERLPPRPRWS